MRRIASLALVFGLASVPLARAEMAIVCTVVAEAGTGTLLKREGDCETRVTPASTFKIALAVIGLDAGILTDEHAPVLPYRPGYPAWMASWKTDTDPTGWIRNSVVWYSQKITEALGKRRFADAVARLDYGNRDVSGDPGKGNGLTRSWIGSSLKISPLEQITFLRGLVGRRLTVTPHAMETTIRLLDTGLEPDGWRLYGKTGSAAARHPDGSLDRERPIGWFVGWAEKDGRRVVFARLVRFDRKPSVFPGLAAKESVIADLFARPGSL